ncbi:hypothetical protein SAMN03159353_101292 [Cedecea sp. NFIX57]|nr:hypothetical protein SAMN03159353_101292 [Cedecea sp. NFIX57]
MARTPIILDTDPGIDDAVALAAALFAPPTGFETHHYRGWKCLGGQNYA